MVYLIEIHEALPAAALIYLFKPQMLACVF